MYELTAFESEQVGGGIVPLVVLAFTIVANSGAFYDFFSGFFDGLGGIAAE